MLLSHRRNFLFIHIPKTAGTSLTRAFAPHARLRDRLVYHYYPTRLGIALVDRLTRRADDGLSGIAGFPQHAAIRNVRDRLGDAKMDALFKFAFVRDPWDWFASLYAHICRTPDHPLADVAMRGLDALLSHAAEGHILRQIDYVRRRGGLDLDLDFVGRFETLAADYEIIAGRLGLSRRDLPHHNPSSAPPPDLAALYNTPARRLFLKRFGADIEAFGYCEAPAAG